MGRTQMMKKICVVVGSRANYSSIKSAMTAIDKHPKLTLQLILGASALLDRYGSVADLIRKDGFVPDAEIFMLLEGETPLTMAKSTGVGLMELPTVFDKLSPDFVLTVGDRFETMATTLAAAYMNIPIAHTMGGEVSGNIDECIRHAVTKFAHIHFPANQNAAERIIKLGESPSSVHPVGCPRIDLIADVLKQTQNKTLEKLFEFGVGAKIDLKKPFILLSQHPVTSEYGNGVEQITLTLEALNQTNVPVIALWPNSDAGADDIARGMRLWREKGLAENMHFFKNLPVHDYVWLMKETACLIGNSSSGIRESAFIGTPTVNIGSRQNNRQRGVNVIDVNYNTKEIYGAIMKQIEKGHYPSNPLYGNGDAGKKIADVLAETSVDTQKTISY